MDESASGGRTSTRALLCLCSATLALGFSSSLHSAEHPQQGDWFVLLSDFLFQCNHDGLGAWGRCSACAAPASQ